MTISTMMYGNARKTLIEDSFTIKFVDTLPQIKDTNHVFVEICKRVAIMRGYKLCSLRDIVATNDDDVNFVFWRTEEISISENI